jgi:hypothetical protein
MDKIVNADNDKQHSSINIKTTFLMFFKKKIILQQKKLII